MSIDTVNRKCIRVTHPSGYTQDVNMLQAAFDIARLTFPYNYAAEADMADEVLGELVRGEVASYDVEGTTFELLPYRLA